MLNQINPSRIIDPFEDRRDTLLESRLLQFYLFALIIWAAFNSIFSYVAGLPWTTTRMYLTLAIGTPIYLLIGKMLHIEKLLSGCFFYLIIIAIPLMWFCAGGNKASANILFALEIVVFTMCLRGKRQVIFDIAAMASTSMVFAVSRINPILAGCPMTEFQSYKASSGIGTSTSILILFLLLKQKQEYKKERDAAITSEKELERSNRLQKNFLANMSHEIRSPLGIVLGFNNLIQQSTDLEQIHEYSRNISNAGKTLHTVINDILDYSKIDSGKLEIIRVNYSLNELLEDVGNDIGLKCSEKGLTFQLLKGEHLPGYLVGDNIRIKQCLLNLLSNAVKYTKEGGVSLIVSDEAGTAENSRMITFQVKDTGQGISEEEIPKLFTSFQRLDEGQNRGIEGTGLGLAITKGLLDEMKGTISVVSKPGAGSEFTIILEQELGETIEKRTQESQGGNRLEGISVLAVDDIKMNLLLVRKVVSQEGAHVFTADSGKGCLEECEKQKFDILLLDHMMPEMNGVDVFHLLREGSSINKDTPVIMLTANAMAGADQEYLGMGFDGYVEKPIKFEALVEEIQRVLGKVNNG